MAQGLLLRVSMGQASPQARWTSIRTALLAAMGLGAGACGTNFVQPEPEPVLVEVDCSNVPDEQAGSTITCEGVPVRREVGSCEPATQCDAFECADCGIDAPCVVITDDGRCGCATPCTEDSQCGSQTCHCGSGGGFCVAQTCRTSADCGEGSECAFYQSIGSDPCFDDLVSGYACTTDADQCLPGHGECDERCRPVNDGRFLCQGTDSCDIGGRPFLIEGSARVSAVAHDGAWPASLAPNTTGSAGDRAVLADHWTRIGQLEHASIAAFARFAMQLMSLGAPPDLLRETTSAMHDELEHARLAYGLASAYAGDAVGPGPLSMQGALDDSDLETIVRTLIEEGCIGETVAAHTAQQESERVSDAQVATVLERIARDEHQHSLLAWRSLAWLVDSFGEPVQRVLARALDGVEQELDEVPPTRRDGTGEQQRALARQGLLTSWEVMAARREVLREVFLPVGRTLLRRDAAQATKAAPARTPSARP